ncbi:DUF4278 domain-containing protein [Phormidium tenue FACHB-886]|nr:DUF4278 domain-containing protein [Phormidium tenue FACHB-886]
MKLIYRGTTLNYDPANINAHRLAKPIKSAYDLIYRGHTCRIEPTAIRHIAVKPTEYKLIYRGVIYQVQRNERGDVIAMSSSNRFKQKTLINAATQKARSQYSVEM